MAVLSNEEFMSKIQGLIGERNDDEALSFLEDTRDTLNARPTEPDPENWKQKYEDNDKMWRDKYRDAFYGERLEPDTGNPAPNNDAGKAPKTFNDLFKEE